VSTSNAPSTGGPVEDDRLSLQSAAEGVGPLVQRDYWAVIGEPCCPPSAVMETVRRRFVELPPRDIVVFERDGDGELEVGDELDIRIRLAGDARVRVVHQDTCSTTFATLVGHPEAGRITFGAYRNDEGRVIFHIRSRARASTPMNYLGFLFGGDPMQTATWTDLVNSVALTCGNAVAGIVHSETRLIDATDLEPADETLDAPTFIARGD
jgi:hypothetical protein